MKRRLFSMLAAVSLVLCAATMALWVRSYFVTDTVSYLRSPRAAREFVAINAKGQLGAGTDDPGGVSGIKLEHAPPRDLTPFLMAFDRYHLLGIHVLRIAQANRPSHWALVLPTWIVMIAAAALPALWFKQERTDRRRRQMLGRFCLNCGYDLRATPERCPECGTMPAGRAVESLP